jgi:hypothetical protein
MKTFVKDVMTASGVPATRTASWPSATASTTRLSAQATSTSYPTSRSTDLDAPKAEGGQGFRTAQPQPHRWWTAMTAACT